MHDIYIHNLKHYKHACSRVSVPLKRNKKKFRDEVSELTIDASDSKRSVGTAPWATAKFEDVEKKLVSPRESEKNDIFNIWQV